MPLKKVVFVTPEQIEACLATLGCKLHSVQESAYGVVEVMKHARTLAANGDEMGVQHLIASSLRTLHNAISQLEQLQ